MLINLQSPSPVARPIGRHLTLPAPRGPISTALFRYLTGQADRLDCVDEGMLGADPACAADALSDDDLHLALYVAYELHYSAIDGVKQYRESNSEAGRIKI